MKNKTVKTKALAGLIALTLIGGMAVTATNAVAKDSLNDDVKVVVASSRSYENSERHAKDSKHEKGERSRKDSSHERDERRSKDYDDDNRSYDGKEITLEQAIKIATDDTEGKVIEVEFERGRYEVKLRTKDGYKREIYISAKDGSIVKRK